MVIKLWWHKLLPQTNNAIRFISINGLSTSLKCIAFPLKSSLLWKHVWPWTALFLVYVFLLQKKVWFHRAVTLLTKPNKSHYRLLKLIKLGFAETAGVSYVLKQQSQGIVGCFISPFRKACPFWKISFGKKTLIYYPDL